MPTTKTSTGGPIAWNKITGIIVAALGAFLALAVLVRAAIFARDTLRKKQGAGVLPAQTVSVPPSTWAPVNGSWGTPNQPAVATVPDAGANWYQGEQAWNASPPIPGGSNNGWNTQVVSNGYQDGVSQPKSTRATFTPPPLPIDTLNQTPEHASLVTDPHIDALLQQAQSGLFVLLDREREQAV